METIADTRVRVLVVEDDFLVRMTLAEAMADEGFDVVEAETGEEALAAIRADSGIALLMTDLALSGRMDGRALAKTCRQERPSLPVIFMTGRPDLVELDPSQREMLVGKPYTPDQICRAARIMIEAP